MAKTARKAALPDMLTAAEFAEHFRIPESQVYRLCRLNKLQHVRLGRYVRIPRSVVLQTEECEGKLYEVVKDRGAQVTQ